jgi:predicted metal-dependent peptidase
MLGWKNMQTTSYKDIFEKIRINFLFNHPFLSVLALSIDSEFKENVNSPFLTDGFKITIDTGKLEKYSKDEITYLYAHTLLHIVLKHPYRQKTRDKYIWNQACDVVINNILSTFENVGIRPVDEILDLTLNDKCVEEVYEILYKKKEELSKTIPDENGKIESNAYDKSKLDLDEVLTKSEKTNQEKLDGIIIQALSLAKKSSNLYEGMSVEIDTLIKPEIDLHDVLKEYLISSFFEKQISYERPNKRFIDRGIYMPGTKKLNDNLNIFVALDSSSSVSLDEYKKFLGIVSEIAESFYEYKIDILPFDLKVRSEYIISFDSFNPLSNKELLIPKSNGGTSFDELLRYLKKSSEVRNDSLLIALTDGDFEMSESLLCNTLFIISNKKNLRKFESHGRVIQFNI